jgi:RNA polymerase sigma-54 factor
MVSLQPRLNLKVAQKQILTPGLVQMVSVLALNKLELRDMIQAEMVENPVLEEAEESVPVLDDVARREEAKNSSIEDDRAAAGDKDKKDSFEEIDFGTFFRDYLDPGYRSPDLESIERPSFENFLSRPSTLTDHLMWQLGAMGVRPEVRDAAELVIGNLDEAGYLAATEDELMAAALPLAPAKGQSCAGNSPAPAPAGLADRANPTSLTGQTDLPIPQVLELDPAPVPEPESAGAPGAGIALVRQPAGPAPLFTRADLREAIDVVRQMDPPGVAAYDLRECLLAQLKYHELVHLRAKAKGGQNGATDEVLHDAVAIVHEHLKLVQNKQTKELAKAIGRPPEAVQAAMDFIRTLDPRPGLRYNQSEPRLIEPDVAFLKQEEIPCPSCGANHGYLAILNDEDVPQLRLNPMYRRLLNRDQAEKDVRTYIKEKYRSAIQLIKNIEQRKQTIQKVCCAIIRRQRDFLDHGIDRLVPMMIKEVAEEIGVHPSTVSRAVANKYTHTPQGVFELRFFFSESVQGPEGGNTSLLILKRRVKKLIEEEDPARPYTDEQITRILQTQGIQVTRRTVAKYREDMRIPSTHQRRIKN